jgi:hypothetical protein
MAKQPTYEELEQRARDLEQEAVEWRQAKRVLSEKQMEISAVLEKAPLIMMLVDQDRRVKKVSAALAEFAGREAGEMLGLRGGEALRCIHRLDDPEGCGFGPACKECTVRRVVLDTFKTGNGYRNVEAKLSFEGDEVEERVLLVTTAPLDVQDKKVFVYIEDITERKRAEIERENLIAQLQESLRRVKTVHGLLPICASCKRIRDDNGYWNQIEGYIRAHSDAEFSHGICPECARKLYPEFCK